ncbi:phosphate ABC transporter permease PstA [Tengunoibacter tsumagoiensis]|uniref:Phosphate transport system permease protein PstA n=1 Tax=Tengunoibacter tsumagoiensis TaxID=2014871 RepID=A0A401ZW58_9CHLR|nr:phosphate ABC transporter permease PstA [Tengunoibacter tsumagoiensis]GCE11087.1 phosphate transport system permease protein PstA [Tengunoibacter tsumagoiensis]
MMQQATQSQAADKQQRIAGLERLVKRLHTSNSIAVTILSIVTGLVVLGFISIIVKLLLDGLPYLINPDFLVGQGVGAVGAQIFNTLYILVFAEILLIPISLAAAIYLIEYAPQGKLVQAIHFAADTLNGVPSIVLGLFGFAFFAVYLGHTFGFNISRLAGALTLLCLNFPIALRLFEDALTSVSREMREGGLALGSTKWHTIRTVVLPSALPGIVTGIVLTAGKIIGESAALVFTMGSTNPLNSFTLNPLISSDTLTVHIWYLKTSGGGLPYNVQNAISAGSSALLIVLLLVINLLARLVGRIIQRRVTSA